MKRFLYFAVLSIALASAVLANGLRGGLRGSRVVSARPAGPSITITEIQTEAGYFTATDNAVIDWYLGGSVLVVYVSITPGGAAIAGNALLIPDSDNPQAEYRAGPLGIVNGHATGFNVNLYSMTREEIPYASGVKIRAITMDANGMFAADSVFVTFDEP